MIKRLLLAAAVAVLTLGWVGTAPSAQAATFSACDGVWVVVDYGALGGGVKSACAASFSTGTAALRSAGFDPSVSDGFVEKIGGKPAKSEPTKSYWSYWQATRKSDGSYGSWSYSNAGSNAYHPKKGDAEGWHYVSLSDPASGPDATPAKNPAAVTPAPTPTTASPTPSKKPSATTKASASASAPSSTKAASATPSASSSSGPTESPTATTEVAATEKGTVPISAASAATEAPSADAQPSSGSPTGTIAAGVAVLAAFGGLGSWWLVKGRRR